MEIPNKLINYLNEKKVGYEILHHPEAFTAQTIAAAEHVKGRHHAKVVMVKSGGEHLMTVLPADSRVDLEKLEKLTGKSTSLEREAEFKDLFPDCAPGTMPPFGDLYGVPTYVDRKLTSEDISFSKPALIPTRYGSPIVTTNGRLSRASKSLP